MWKLAAFLTMLVVVLVRFIHLGSFPSGLTKDESYYGYDAYSVLKTGRDIWGASYPLLFRSTGEYKLNLTYLIIPAVKFFGLSELAVRLPSALFGFGTLIALFATLGTLFRQRWLTLVATLVFALSPWALGMSRLFYESNVGLFFIAWGLYGVLSGRYTLAAVLLAVSAYMYNPYRYIGLALLTLALVTFPLSKAKQIKTVVIYLLFLFPLLFASPEGVTTKRLSQELLLRKTDYTMVVNDMRAKCQLHFGPQIAKFCYVLWNKPVLHAASVAATTFHAISPQLLFVQSNNEYIIPKGYGMYLGVGLPLYLLGFCWLLGFFPLPGLTWRLRVYFTCSLLAATLITSTPGTLELYRYPVSMYLIFLIMAAGLNVFRLLVHKVDPRTHYLVIALIATTALFQQVKFLVSYRLSSPSLPLLFASDAREIFTYLEGKRDYRYIVDRKFHGPITAAFFWAIDPAEFQENIVWTDPDPWGFVSAYRLGNIYSQTYTVEQLLCEKHKNPDTPLRAAVIDDPGRYSQLASLTTHDETGTLELHHVFDIDELYPRVVTRFPSDLCKL